MLENIQAVKDILDIKIRLNISDESKKDIEELYELLTKKYEIQKNKISLYGIKQYNKDTGVSNYSNATSNFINDFMNRHNIKNSLLRRSYGCPIRNKNYYCIYTNGDLYPCQTVIGKKEHYIGNIKTGLNKENYNEIWDIEKSINDLDSFLLLLHLDI